MRGTLLQNSVAAPWALCDTPMMPVVVPGPDDHAIRAVQDVADLRRTFAAVAPLLSAQVDPEQDFRFDRLLTHFADDHTLMLVVEVNGQILGAALGYRSSPDTAKLQVLAVAPPFRRAGVGRRLIGELERRAQVIGCTSIVLGAEESARPFYTALGYRGRRGIVRKSLANAMLTGSPTARRNRLHALREARSRRTDSTDGDTSAIDRAP